VDREGARFIELCQGCARHGLMKCDCFVCVDLYLVVGLLHHFSLVMLISSTMHKFVKRSYSLTFSA